MTFRTLGLVGKALGAGSPDDPSISQRKTSLTGALHMDVPAHAGRLQGLLEGWPP